MATLPDTVFYRRLKGGNDSSWSQVTMPDNPTDGGQYEYKHVSPSKSAFIVADTTVVGGTIDDALVYYYDEIEVDASEGFTGTNLKYSLVSAPAWVEIDPDTGELSGSAPAVTLDTSITVRAKNSTGGVNISFPLAVTEGPPAIAGAVAIFDPSVSTSWASPALYDDLSNSGNPVSQPTSGYQGDPASQCFRGRRVVKIDGVDDYLTYGKQTLGSTGLRAHASGGSSFTVFTTFRLTRRLSMAIAKSGTSAANRQFAIGSFDSGNDNLSVYLSGTATTIKSNAIGLVLTVGLTYDFATNTATALVMAENETEWTEVSCTVGSGASQAVNILLGARTSAGNLDNAQGWLGETRVYDFAFDSTQKTQQAAYYAYRWMNKQPDAHVIFVGDSQTEQGFGDVGAGGGISYLTNKIGLLHAKYVTGTAYGRSGWTSTQIKNQIAADLANHSSLNCPTYVHLMMGGNDVSNYKIGLVDAPTAKSTLHNNVEGCVEEVLNKGFIPMISEITYRMYNSIVTESNGSKPFNDDVIRPLMLEHTPNFVRPDGTPFYEIYDMMYQHHPNSPVFKSLEGSYFEGDEGSGNWIHPNNAGEDAYCDLWAATYGAAIFGQPVPPSIHI